MKISRMMIAAPCSGSGKTTITCGLLQALVNRKRKVVSFKCGPDYIDPMFHRSVMGVPTGNLDAFFTDTDIMRYLFTDMCRREQADITLVEGVMGYYDGKSATSIEASSCEIAEKLGLPVLLVVNGSGASLSIAAMIKGFLTYRVPTAIKGILLNQVPASIYPALKQTIEQELHVPVVGYLPNTKQVQLQSRHLGLVLPEEVSSLQEQLQILAAELEQTVDIDKIITIAEETAFISEKEPVALEDVKRGIIERETVEEKTVKERTTEEKPKVRIAVARDAAFCFYYQENLRLLEELGAEIVFFSPLSDTKLPVNVQGLLLGGGYPELYVRQLSENVGMRKAILTALQNGMPCIAECGGFLYLQQQLSDAEGNRYPMVGYLSGEGKKAEKRTHFGYITITLQEDTIIGSAGTKIPAHEFHYWESSMQGQAARAEKPDGIRSWMCMQTKQNVAAGFPHLYLYGNPTVAAYFIKQLREQAIAKQ